MKDEGCSCLVALMKLNMMMMNMMINEKINYFFIIGVCLESSKTKIAL
jgi:hypothetical protein